jgi:hypothetical protein
VDGAALVCRNACLTCATITERCVVNPAVIDYLLDMLNLIVRAALTPDVPLTDAAWLAAQADRCRRLASSIDCVTSARLLTLADKFESRLTELMLE